MTGSDKPAARYVFDADVPFGLPFRPTPFTATFTGNLGQRDSTMIGMWELEDNYGKREGKFALQAWRDYSPDPGSRPAFP